MKYFIGIDTSTSATKALVMDEDGQVVGVASNEYPFETPHPLWSEQDPVLWWRGTVDSIRQVMAKTAVDPSEVKAIGLTGQMHGLVLLDEKGMCCARRFYGMISAQALSVMKSGEELAAIS